MKIAIAGGGPGGLYFAALMKGLDPTHEVTVWERNAPDDTFGFGVVFSDETLGSIEGADQVVHEQMESRFARWTDIDVDCPTGTAHHSFTVGGQGFAAMSRKELLRILQERVAELGVTVHYRTTAPDADELRASHDLVRRRRRPQLHDPHQVRRRLRARPGPAAQQVHLVRHRPGLRGVPVLRQADAVGHHADPRLPLLRSGVDLHRRDARGRLAPRRPRPDRGRRASPPGVSDEYAVERIAEIFADELQGHEILTNNSKWLNFHTVRNERWHDGNVVLLGDAAHTAHFSIGSGTKLAMEDALALAACLHEHPTVEAALAAYQDRAQAGRGVDAARRPGVAGVVREHRHVRRPGPRRSSCFNLLTRSRRITFDNLEERDHEFADADGGGVRSPARTRQDAAPAMFQPVTIGELELKNRDRSSRRWTCTRRWTACPDEFHLVHLGSKALGGAGPGDDRDGLRLARRADHAGLHRAVQRRAARRLDRTDRRLRARQHAPPGSAPRSATPAARARPS